MEQPRETRREKNLSICGFVHVCEVKICVHKEPHQFNDGCKGMCKYMGYAECRTINKNYAAIAQR
jgi:hypothetical protein